MVYDSFNFICKLTFGKIFNYLVLKLTYAFSIALHKPIIWGNPAFATIEPTNNCNLRCPECPAGNQTLTREKGYIELSLYTRIIKELSPNLMWLMLYFEGEPFLHKNLPELVRYAADRKIYTVISTNGHYLNETNAKEIITSGLDRIIISLDGADPETYSVYRKGGDFNTVVSGIKHLVTLKKQLHSHKPCIILQCLLMKHTENQTGRLKTLGRDLGVDKVVFKTLQVTDFKNNFYLLPENTKYSRYKTTDGNEVVLKNKIPNRCSRIWNTIVLLHNGIIVPCCFDKDADFVMGNFSLNQVSDIWKNEKFKRFRRQILNNRENIKMCCNCTDSAGKIGR